METSVAATLGASVTAGTAAAEDDDTDGAPSVDGDLRRFASTALGAEVTGPCVLEDGTLVMSLQHPSRDNAHLYDRAGVGYFRGFQFDLDGDGDDFDELSAPTTEAQRRTVRGTEGDFVPLVKEADPIQGGEERLGVVQTPDGTDVTTDAFVGTQYGNAAYNPDCNQFVPTPDGDHAGYLFTNWENSPGNVTRVPIDRDGDGELSPVLEDALNLANTDALREQGGTRINCYGDLSPWGTMVSSEENYAHTRVSLTATVGDVVDAGSGQGLVGGAQFWNRPNPVDVQDAVDEYYGDDSWYVQGYWALTGVEFLAYYLGADPVERESEDDANPTQPIGDTYPNPYRYGYHIDVREPTADEPTPVKYYVMGRSAWEAPDIQTDERTVYQCSDGDSKGVYKFVADDPIPSYDDPMDVAGTLYAPKVTPRGDAGTSPASTPLDVEWMALGSASNREVESWIAAYDDVTQVDYLETHADTDWEEDLATALEEADKAVVADGNQNYVTNEEIVEWADQYDANGPDGVDEALRKVPFLETRAAAKEVGASIEFNKAEGVDSIEGAGPGDDVYFGISEFNDDLSDDTGDLRLSRVDGGVVYRATLEADYNVSTLDPVITGPDGSDPAAVADDALVNVDNVYVMDDGRVLCCEDADQFGRSYSNDCLYVYDPAGGAPVETGSNSASQADGAAGADVQVPDIARPSRNADRTAEDRPHLDD